MKIIICSAMTLIMLFFSATFAFTAGSLFGTGTCPVPGITGHTQSLTFTILDGPAPPGSRITAVAGSCTVLGDFPITTLLRIIQRFLMVFLQCSPLPSPCFIPENTDTQAGPPLEPVISGYPGLRPHRYPLRLPGLIR